jgi:type VII secretion protein EccE
MTVTATKPAPAASRSGSGSARRTEPVLILPRRRPGFLGPVHVTQLLVAELVVMVLLVAVSEGVVAVVGALITGSGLLLITLARRGGRWWMERRVMTWHYRRRRRRSRHTDPPSNDPRLAELRRFAPGMIVQNVSVADGAQVGVARDDTGWYAVAALSPRTVAHNDLVQLPLDELAAAVAEADQPGAVLQIVTQTVPAPSTNIPAASPAGSSYQQLLARFGDVSIPAERTTWVAVRLDARMLAEATAGDPIELEVAPAVVAALIRRVVKSQRRAGVTLRLLDADALLDALVRACDLERPPSGTNEAQPREHWSMWRSAWLAHRSFWVRDWPAVSKASAMLDKLATSPSAMTTVAVIIAPEQGGQVADLRALVRVAALAGELGNVTRALRRRASEAKADLFALDGEQAPAVYASAPTGGGAQ